MKRAPSTSHSQLDAGPNNALDTGKRISWTDKQNTVPSEAWERRIRCEPMKPFERNPTGESPVRPKP